MERFGGLTARLRALLRRGAWERELDDEFRFHIEMQIEENLRLGMSPKEARRRALIAFGGLEQQREATRATRMFRGPADALSDVRYAMRSLSRSPMFSAVAVLTLVLGIGPNAGLFGLVDALFFRIPPGLADGATLTRITPVEAGSANGVTYPVYGELVEGSTAFEGIAACWTSELDLGVGSEPVRLKAGIVSGNYFELLGVRPVLGRGFTPDEGRPGSAGDVVVLGHDLWQRYFGADPDVLGRSLQLHGARFTVIGVAPPRFVGTELRAPAQLWVPATSVSSMLPQESGVLGDYGLARFALVGRLPGRARAREAEAELDRIGERLDRASPDRNQPWYRPFRFSMYPLRGWYPFATGAEAFPPLLLAWLVTGLVLLVACANLANLMLVRALARRREIGIRLALGISRRRLVRLLLTEAGLLALVGGALGLVASLWIADYFQARLLRDFGTSIAPLDVSPDLATLTFTVGLTAVTALMFGLIPALRASRQDLNAVIKGDDARRLGHPRLRTALMVTQVALSMVLLFTGGLFVRKLQLMRHQDPGFDTENVLRMSLDLTSRGYSEPDRSAFYERLLARTEQVPGVESATAPTASPLGRIVFVTNAYVPSEAAGVGSTALSEEMISAAVGPGYFRTLGIPVLGGRGIEARDVRARSRVAVLSESLAQRFWPGEQAIGRTLVNATEPDSLVEVVGVVGDVSSSEVGAAAEPHIYLPVAVPGRATENLLVRLRSGADATEVATAIREEIRRMDATLPVFGVQTLATAVAQQVGFQRGFTTAIGVCGVLALLLAALGLYGVIALLIEGRGREIGVRRALGASDRALLGTFLLDGVRLAALGLMIGTPLAALAGVLVRAILVGVQVLDIPTLLVVAALLCVTSLFATYLPTRRALRLDPLVALRAE